MDALLLSVAVPHGANELHLSLRVHDRGGSIRLIAFRAYGRKNPLWRREQWIWIDWRLAFRCLGHWILEPFRYITRKFSFISPRSKA